MHDDDLLDSIIEGVQNAHGSDVALGTGILVDGKPEQGCRPSSRATKKRGFTYKDDIQRSFYNRYYKGHGLKIAHHIWGDGLVQVAVGSINDPDQRLLENSGLLRVLDELATWRESRGKIRLTIYGDPAYRNSRNVRAKTKGAMTAIESAENNSMIRARSASEDTFHNFVDLFKLFDDRKSWKILTHARNTFEDSLVMATIWYNLHTCLYGNEANSLSMTEACTIEEYMCNINLNQVPVLAKY